MKVEDFLKVLSDSDPEEEIEFRMVSIFSDNSMPLTLREICVRFDSEMTKRVCVEFE